MDLGKKKTSIIIGAVLLILAGVTLYYASQQRQDIRQRASVTSGGRYHVSLIDPASIAHQIEQTFPTEIRLSAEDNANNKVSAVALKLSYTYGAQSPELIVVDVNGVETDEIILAETVTGGDWSCPTNHITKDTNAKRIIIEFLCVNTGAGFALEEYDPTDPSVGNLIATVNFKVVATPDPNPIAVSFDQAESIVTRKEDGRDYLAIPNSAHINVSTSGGSCTDAHVADIDCDGVVDLVDLATVASNWGSDSEVARADVNGDGVVDLVDLATVSINWTR